MSSAIHWFRRDLRLSDNTALNAAAKAHASLVPAYVLSSWKGQHRWTGPARQQFLCDALASLAAKIRDRQGRLIIRQGDPVDELLALAKEVGATAIYTNRDPDPHGRAVEARLEKAARSAGLTVHLFKDHAMHERDEVLTESGTPFRVFTPYSRAWGKRPKIAPDPHVVKLADHPTARSLPLPDLSVWGLERDQCTLPAASEAAAQARLESFLEKRVLAYAEHRDFPAQEGTSRISQDLRFGLLSIRSVYAQVKALMPQATLEQQRNAQIFLNELCWREFYFQVLWNAPHVLEHEYGEAYRGLPWHSNPGALERWQAGQTGFPIVDAGMRQLAQTGFMHNRVRMITAMFLTKDLHLDWREGERWFMQRLLDAEIASNNGGWQWSAGTGTDAAPYFRIQNPWTQSERFDIDGEYIKKWVPELRNVHSARLHKAPTPGLRLTPAYPLPMVDHATERDACLHIYHAHLGKSPAPKRPKTGV